MNKTKVIGVASLTWETSVENSETQGAWGAQSVECLTRGFGSGHDMRVVRSSPMCDSALRGESAWDSLSHSLQPSCSCSLSQKINLKKKESGWTALGCNPRGPDDRAQDF